jgi:hypothetical protein
LNTISLTRLSEEEHSSLDAPQLQEKVHATTVHASYRSFFIHDARSCAEAVATCTDIRRKENGTATSDA